MKLGQVAAVALGLVVITAGVVPAAASTVPGAAPTAGPAGVAGSLRPAASGPRGEMQGQRTAAGAISGSVLGAHSAPLAGACVTATGPAASFTVPTRSDGRFLISALPPGRYVLQYRDCSAPSRYFAQWSGGAGSPQAATALMVPPGQQRMLAPVTLRPTNPALLLQARPAWQRRPASDTGSAAAAASTGAISGLVTGRGRPLRGICVSASGPNGSFDATTAKNGRYMIRRIPAGRFVVEFTTTEFGCSNHGSWLTQWYRNINTPFFPAKPKRVRIRAGHTTKGINGRLKLGGKISGTVRSSSGSRLRGICVSAQGRLRDGRLGTEVRTSARGRYNFHGLFPGTYTVSFTRGCGNNGNFLPQSWHNVGPNGRPTPIRITGDRVVTGVNASLKPGAVIIGKVRLGSKTGQALRGICVGTENRSTFAFASTRADGSYRLAGLSTGKFRVFFQPGCGNNGNFTSALSRPVSVRAGRTTRLTGILQPGATISGVVTDTDGNPVRGICIEVEGPPFGSPVSGIPTTRKDGSYRIRQLSKGRYELQFSGGCGSKGSFAPQNYQNRADLDLADPIDVSTGEQLTGINAVMQPGATISGRVTNTAGRGLPGVCVAPTTPAFAQAEEFDAILASGRDGRYRLTNLAPGQYELAFFGGCGSGDLAEQWYRAQPGSSTATMLSAAGGRPITGIDAVMHPGGAISGTVTDSAGHRLSSACVYALHKRTGGETIEDPAFTDDGRYFFDDLAAGRYLVLFTECGFGNFRDQWYRGKARPSAATPVTVTGRATTRNIDARLRPGGKITGTVTGSSGQPLRNICVTAFNATTESFGTSGKTGRYAVPDLSTGRYHVEFASCSFGSTLASTIRRTTVRIVAPRTVSGINGRLAAGGAISGTLLTASPAGKAAGVCAEAVPVSPDGAGNTAVSGRTGFYTIRALAPGRYRVFFGDQLCFDSPPLATQWYDGQQSEAATTIITVTSGHTTTDIGATLLSDGAISGTVSSASAAGLSGACVIAQRLARRSQPVQAVSDDAGSYTLIDLAPGKYRVKFTAGCGLTGFATQWWKDASSAASATIINVRAARSLTGIDAILRQGSG